MAKDAAAKLALARRLVAFACERHGLPRHDLLIDPLTFTICTGNADDRRLGIETLDAIAAIAAEFPEIQIILGLSNISFGLNPAARHVLNSVFLDHAQRRGLTGAILHSSKIMPLHKIAPEEVGARRGPDLRPPARRATTRCRRSWRASPTARPRRRRRSGRPRSRSASRSGSSTATARGSRPTSTRRWPSTRRSTSSTSTCWPA